jgi:hypothetical protein
MSAILAVSLFAVMAASRPSGSLLVTATVMPYLQSSVTETGEVLVSEADVRAGFVEVGGPRLDIRTNDRRGYIALFRFENGPFQSAVVTGFPHGVEVGPAGAFVSETPTSLATSVQLHYRLRLKPSALTGSYRSPLTVKVLQSGRNTVR